MPPERLDRHREVIEAKAQLPGATKRGIYEYLIDRCYAGEEPPAYNTLTKWMRRNGIECGRPPEGPEPHPRFETAPGEQMQFDWKESLRMADAEGEVFEFNVFSATLGYSRLHRFVYSRTRTEDDVMACLLAVMAANGGTARTLVTDNMSSIVSSSASGRRVSARFARFAAAAGFELELARPRSPQTKGKVESSNRFLSRLAVYEGDFRGEEGLVAAIARIEARCNTEPSASTGVPPAVLFMREKEELRKVGNMGLLESMVADVSVQAVPPTMLVRCRGREFSVPRRCIGRRVKVLAMPSGQVRVEMAGETVAVHDLSAPGGPVVYDPAHYAEALAAKARYADADIEAAAPRQPGAARQARGGVAVSARDEGGAYARIRENLSELGLDAMAAGLPHWMSAVAAGRGRLRLGDARHDLRGGRGQAPSRDRPQGARRRLPVRQDAGRLRLLLPALHTQGRRGRPGPRSGSWTRPRTWFWSAARAWARPTSRWRWGWRRCAPARRCASPTARRWCAT